MPEGLTLRTNGVWGTGKGSNLEPAEVDTNFWNTILRIIALEANAPEPNNISSIVLEGNALRIIMQDASEFGPFELPTAAFRWRGSWTAATVYDELDLFSVAGSGVYLVLVPHTSAAAFDPNAVDESTDALGPLYFLVFGMPATPLLGELTDVFIDGTPPDGAKLVWSQATAKWVYEVISVADVSDAVYVPTLADANGVVRCTNVGGCLVIIPNSTAVEYPLGTVLSFEQSFADGGETDDSDPTTVSVVGADTDVAINCPASRLPQTAEQWATIRLRYLGDNEWTLFTDGLALA